MPSRTKAAISCDTRTGLTASRSTRRSIGRIAYRPISAGRMMGPAQDLFPLTMGWMAPAPDGAKMSPCVDGSRVESGRYRSCSSCRVQSCVRPVHAVCALLALKDFAGPSPLSFKRAVSPNTLTGFGWSLAIDHLLPSLTSRTSTSCASHRTGIKLPGVPAYPHIRRRASSPTRQSASFC